MCVCVCVCVFVSVCLFVCLSCFCFSISSDSPFLPSPEHTLPHSLVAVLLILSSSYFFISETLKSPPVAIIKRGPPKHDKSRSESSTSRNSKLDDVLLRNMMAAPTDVKPPLQAPSQTDTQHPGIQNCETQIGAKARTLTSDRDLKVPAQSVSHKFFSSKKARNADLVPMNAKDFDGEQGRVSKGTNLMKQDSSGCDNTGGREAWAPANEESRVKELIDFSEIDSMDFRENETKGKVWVLCLFSTLWAFRVTNNSPFSVS